MNLGLVNEITKDQMKSDLPELAPGQTVRVDVKIKEGDKSRIQAYEGVVVKVQGSGISQSFTVFACSFFIVSSSICPFMIFTTFEMKSASSAGFSAADCSSVSANS
ncbi:MAG: 50S ribosomal protein L19, partial [Erysipelotrichaceae bacterium]|nr:50S ribosomal protein L19 [Erysipelotrichaceae bacterium]